MKAALVGLALLTAAPAAHAFGRETTAPVRGEIDASSMRTRADGVYGRFDGDLDFGLGAGGHYDGSAERFGLGTRLSAHYFSLAGVYVEYSDALGRAGHTSRSLGFGADVRPLFIPRWAMDMQQGGAFTDLTLDSISLALGAYFAEPDASHFGDEKGFSATLGFGLPLALYASGPWLEFRAGLQFPDAGETRGTVLAMLSWHLIALTPLSPDE